jgi:hypothetical protein
MTRSVRVRREVQREVYAYLAEMIRVQDFIGPASWLSDRGVDADIAEVAEALHRATDALIALAERRAGGAR